MLQSPQMNGGNDLGNDLDKEDDDSRHEDNNVQLLSTGDGDSGVASAEERQPDEVMPSFDAPSFNAQGIIIITLFLIRGLAPIFKYWTTQIISLFWEPCKHTLKFHFRSLVNKMLVEPQVCLNHSN